MQKHVNLVDLVKSFPTNILLQNFASIQKGTSPVKFAHLAEKSENGSMSTLSTKGLAGRGRAATGSGGAALRSNFCNFLPKNAKIFEKIGLSGAKACKSCRSRQELSNEYLLAKFGVDADENEPCKVCSFG